MTQSEFVASLETVLTGTRYDRRQLVEFVAGAWLWIADDPDVWRWSREFAAGLAPRGAENVLA